MTPDYEGWWRRGRGQIDFGNVEMTIDHKATDPSLIQENKPRSENKKVQRLANSSEEETGIAGHNINNPEVRLDLSELQPETRRRLLWAMTLNCFLLLATLLSLAALIVKGHVVVEERGAVVAKPQQWAVLVAGSKGWDNYRHQADVCHAFHLLVKRGVPKENIVVMMYDDIAYNPANPDQGQIVNKPNGTNLYPGVPKDYTGESVTPKIFLSILQGDRDGVEGRGSGKVLESGPEDHVFVYFADHGASGIVAFPSDYLDAIALNRTLQDMAAKRRFAKLLFYLESCESGSMFEGVIAADIGILAVTASNSTSPSFATNYDARLNTFLSDEFSLAWMEETEMRGNKESILEQAEAVAKMIEKYSKPGIYGELDLEDNRVADFQGEGEAEDQRELEEGDKEDAVVSYDVPLLSRRGEDLHKLKKGRRVVEEVTRELVFRVTGEEKEEDEEEAKREEGVRDWDCYLSVLSHYHKHCFNLGQNAWALRQVVLDACVKVLEWNLIVKLLQVSSLDSLCGESGSGANKSMVITRAIRAICTWPKMIGLD